MSYVTANLPSTKPLLELEPMLLECLRVQKHHVGKVLIVRVVSDAIRCAGLHSIVEDKIGTADCLPLKIGTLREASQVLAKDEVYAIKEPRYSEMLATLTITVDNISDLIPLKDDHELMPSEFNRTRKELGKTAQTLKSEGNALYQAGKLRHALDKYTAGIEIAEGTIKKDLYRNRALIFSLTHQHENAAADAHEALLDGDDDASRTLNAKALYRAGCANYDLERFTEAEKLFKHALLTKPGDQRSVVQLARTERRLREMTEGRYNLSTMRNAAFNNPCLDCASYVCAVEVRDTQHRGRGLFAVKDIKAGELITCEKAFALATTAEALAIDWTAVTRTGTATMLDTAQAQLVLLMDKCMERSRHSLDDAIKFFSLWPGASQKTFVPLKLDGTVVLNPNHGKNIVENCAVTGMYQTNDPQVCPTGSAIWPLHSSINHDCLPNAYSSVIGDMLFLIAFKNIAIGEEITLSYLPPGPALLKRKECLAAEHGFECLCVLCRAEKKVTRANLETRMNLYIYSWVDEGLSLARHSQTSRDERIRVVEAVYNKIAATYDKTDFYGLPRLACVAPAYWLLNHKLPERRLPQLRASALKVLRDLGFKIINKQHNIEVDRTGAINSEISIDVALILARVYQLSNSHAEARAYESLAEELHRIRNNGMQSFPNKYDLLP